MPTFRSVGSSACSTGSPAAAPLSNGPPRRPIGRLRRSTRSTPSAQTEGTAEEMPEPEPSSELLIRPAARADVGLLLQMFGELAEYEHLEEQMQADEERLTRALFGEHRSAEAIVAERGSQAAGYAVY